MKILGCFKVVPDYDLVAEEDWKPDEQLHIDTGYVKLCGIVMTKVPWR